MSATGLYTPYNDATQSNGVLTPRLWKRADLHRNSGNPDGSGATDIYVPHFKTFGGLVASNVGHYSDPFAGHYYSREDTSNTIATIATDRNGVLRSTCSASAAQENYLQPGSTTAVSGVISETAGSNKVLIYEARVRPSSVTNNAMGFFVGLSEEGSAAADMLVDTTGALVDKDFIGFHVLPPAASTVLFKYRCAGQTAVTVMTYGTALVAATWVNLAFIYDPLASPSKRIAIWIDGVEQSTYVATGTGTGQLGAATFPLGEELQPIFGHKNGSTGTATTFDIAGFRFYQEN